jgi:hypothetical protein
MVRQSHWRGELLDGAALAAQELGRPDLGKRLEAAWRAAPTMTRLLRWLAVDGDEYERIRSKAAKSLALCPTTAARQIGLLRVLVGDITGAAAVLAKSPGLGWSNPDHPGHALFPVLALLLSNGTIGGALVTELEATGRDPLESFAMPEEEHKPRGHHPSWYTIQACAPHRPDRPGSRRRHRRDAHRSGEANCGDPRQLQATALRPRRAARRVVRRLCAQESRVRALEMGCGSPPTVLAPPRVQRGAGASV